MACKGSTRRTQVTAIRADGVYVDGTLYKYPGKKVRNKVSVINGSVCCDWYELVKGKWRVTPRSIFRYLF